MGLWSEGAKMWGITGTLMSSPQESVNQRLDFVCICFVGVHVLQDFSLLLDGITKLFKKSSV